MVESHAAELESAGKGHAAGPLAGSSATPEGVGFVRAVGAQELSFASEKMDAA